MRKQKICFIRHGVAKHNVKDPLTGAAPNLKSPLFFDPHLLYDGKRMALEAGERLKRWWQTTQLGEEIELVITSPLTRCIQTTMFAFLPGECYTSNEKARQEPKLYCTELVREAFGMHYPDRRRDLTVLKKHWSIFEFDETMTETDEEWSPTSRETVSQLLARIDKFLHILAQRPENNIVVVTHGVWIEACLNAYCPDALDYGRRRVYNCEAFVGDCQSDENAKFIGLQNIRLLH